MVVDQPVYSIRKRPTSDEQSGGLGGRSHRAAHHRRPKPRDGSRRCASEAALHDSSQRAVDVSEAGWPRLRGRSPIEDPNGREQASGRWLEQMASDPTALGLIGHHKLSGDRVFYAFCSPPARVSGWTLLGVVEGEVGTDQHHRRTKPDTRAAAVGCGEVSIAHSEGNAAQVRAVLGWNRPEHPRRTGSLAKFWICRARVESGSMAREEQWLYRGGGSLLPTRSGRWNQSGCEPVDYQRRQRSAPARCTVFGKRRPPSRRSVESARSQHARTSAARSAQAAADAQWWIGAQSDGALGCVVCRHYRKRRSTIRRCRRCDRARSCIA